MIAKCCLPLTKSEVSLQMNNPDIRKNQVALRKPIAFLILSIAMSFFGYLYEQIDFIPNYLVGVGYQNASLHWSNFHQVTNPAYYHILPACVAIVCIISIWRQKRTLSNAQHKALLLITIVTVLTNVLTTLAVTQINDQLFFGQSLENTTDIKTLALQWSILNILRLLFLFICGQQVITTFRHVFFETT